MGLRKICAIRFSTKACCTHYRKGSLKEAMESGCSCRKRRSMGPNICAVRRTGQSPGNRSPASRSGGGYSSNAQSVVGMGPRAPHPGRWSSGRGIATLGGSGVTVPVGVVATLARSSVSTSDRYRWLEADVCTDAGAADWVTAQDKVTGDYLAALPGRNTTPDQPNLVLTFSIADDGQYIAIASTPDTKTNSLTLVDVTTEDWTPTPSSPTSPGSGGPPATSARRSTS